MCGRMRGRGIVEVERSTANRRQRLLRVKGQPPESVNAVNMGTNQSKRRGRIDHMLAHIDAEQNPASQTAFRNFCLDTEVDRERKEKL